MAFDRSKFKATQVATLKEQEAANKTANNNSDNDGRVPFHKIEEGTSKWRIMPAHPDSKSFMQPKQVHWLPQEVTYTKDGKEITEIKRRPIFNSRTHAGTSKDIIEEYINFVTKMVYEEVQDQDERKKRLFNLTDWKVGVRGRTTWIVYAQKIEGKAKTLGRLELPGLIKDKMNELAITEDQSDAVIQTDPFTDPDTGKAILITYDKTQKEPAKKYAATLEWRGDYKLTDGELEELMGADSLESIYKNSYKRKDFERALDGLRIFDEENGYNAFGHDDWLDICEHMDKMYPEEEEGTEKAPKTSKAPQSTAKGVEDVDYEEEEEDAAHTPDTSSKGDLPWEDQLDTLNREALKTFIKDKGLSIKVLQKYTDDDLRDLIREEMAGAEEDEEEAEEPATEAPAAGSGSRLAAMRAKLGK